MKTPPSRNSEPNYGPQHEHVVALLARIETLTEKECVAIWTSWLRWNQRPDRTNGLIHAAHLMALSAASSRSPSDRKLADDLGNRAFAAAEARRPGDGMHRLAAQQAITGLFVRDCIALEHIGFSQDDYDRLTWHWRLVIGPAHPDDGPVWPDPPA